MEKEVTTQLLNEDNRVQANLIFLALCFIVLCRYCIFKN